ncbi:cupin domain-containing protein [Novipirellula rosea]|uniref:Cupin domain-containing protein n=1 Tax=Novipirellula rosea TaxID=1031540 RepID=A0ABP8NCR3_9BACT
MLLDQRHTPPERTTTSLASKVNRAKTAPQLVDLTALPAVACPCGTARRAFADRPEFPGTVHLTEITQAARTHYHNEHVEVYIVLECESDAAIELDGVLHPVRPLTAILIPAGVRHRAVGEMKTIILSSPNFDASDEHFDLE